MDSEAIEQDFKSALVRHFAFKARLRSFLYGNGTSAGPLRDPDQCTLGQWIRERRNGLYQHVTEMAELDHLHRHIHEQANRLMDLYEAGDVTQAQAGFAEVQHTADLIVEVLRTIEAHVRTAGVRG